MARYTYANTSSYRRSQKKRRFRKRARGKYSLKKTVKRILNKQTETKYFDVAGENLELYHNVGQSGGVALATQRYSDPTFFNPWSDIPPGTGRANRIGDKITPLCMTLRLWLANKADRPAVMYRIIIAKLPKSYNNITTTSSSILPFQFAQLGATGNVMCLPIDHDKGIKPYYDRTFNMQATMAAFSGSITGNSKEQHKLIKIKIRRKRASPIVYDSSTQLIVNSPLALYVFPYDSYGSLVTDNIASYSYTARMYYKDA